MRDSWSRAGVLLVAAAGGYLASPGDCFVAPHGRAGLVEGRVSGLSQGIPGRSLPLPQTCGGAFAPSHRRRMEFEGEAAQGKACPESMRQGSRARRSFGPSMQVKPAPKSGGESAGVAPPSGGEIGGGPAVSGQPPPSPKDSSNIAAWISVAVLLGLNIHNQWSRALIYYLVNFKAAPGEASSAQFMNVDLGFDETQYSLLASFAFTGLFTATSLVAGRAADLFDRAKVLTVAALMWSAATAATGMSNSFDNVAVVRGVQGVSQAFVGPQAYGLIATIFKGENMATANSVYASGIYVGGALASLSILLNSQLGWRETNFVVGGAGVVLVAAAALLLRDPRSDDPAAMQRAVNGGKGGEEAQPLINDAQQVEEEEDGLRLAFEAAKTVLGNRFVQYLFVASAFRFCAGYGIGVWKAPFFREAFPDFTNEFSVANAFIISGGGILSSILGGIISDKFSPRDQRVQVCCNVMSPACPSPNLPFLEADSALLHPASTSCGCLPWAACSLCPCGLRSSTPAPSTSRWRCSLLSTLLPSAGLALSSPQCTRRCPRRCRARRRGCSRFSRLWGTLCLSSSGACRQTTLWL